MTEKKPLKSWCDKYKINQSTARAISIRLNVGEKKYGLVWFTETEFKKIVAAKQHHGRPFRCDITKENIEALMTEGLTAQQVAIKFETSLTTILRRLK